LGFTCPKLYAEQCALTSAYPSAFYSPFPSALQDFLFRYKAAVEGVTAEDVLGAAQRHLHPQQQTVVVVGDASAIKPQLQAAGFSVQPLLLPKD
jgi:zinc protease